MAGREGLEFEILSDDYMHDLFDQHALDDDKETPTDAGSDWEDTDD